jgi:2-polyprenyl-6-methoxyphenol hydroxylase-like FAD-dependent oxidoreductase
MSRDHAIVIGGSFSGLFAGRVLAEFFNHVTVLDRDTFPAGIKDRAGVPQARHVHGLLVRGLREYEREFPGFERLAVEKGATFHDHTFDFVVLRPAGWQPRYRSDLKFLSASRELIESCVRELFRELPRVELRERTAVTGLKIIREGSARRCAGVRVAAAEGSGAGIIEADLVVDGTGGVSRAPLWLSAAGVTPPDESIVDPLAGYSSRWFQGPPPGKWPADWWWWAGAYIRRRPDDLTEANFQLKESNRWHLTLSGFNRQYPPTREADFMALLTRLRSPIIAEMVRLMEPISPVYANRAMRNRWRHYERWRERLAGFVAIGDAFCHYNPVYAQGMTALALSASALRAGLATQDSATPEFAHEFFRAQARIQRDPWLLSAGVDLRFPFTLGRRSIAMKFLNIYMDGIGLAAKDAIVRRRLVEVAQLVRPLSDLMTPAIVARVGLAAAAAAARAVTRIVIPRQPMSISPMPPVLPAQARDIETAATEPSEVRISS